MKNNSKKIILDLCDGTGAWSNPYKDAGYDVRNITLPDFDVLEWKKYGEVVVPIETGKVYGIFAAPPCTMFSIARTTAKEPRDLKEGMKVVKACLDIIWTARENNKLAFWALENPRGILRQFLGKPAMTFQPNEFGELYTKHTDIWGYFKEPTKSPVVIPNRIKMQLAKNNRILSKLPEGYKEPGRRNQAARRAMTSPKFAKAFFRSNL